MAKAKIAKRYYPAAMDDMYQELLKELRSIEAHADSKTTELMKQLDAIQQGLALENAVDNPYLKKAAAQRDQTLRMVQMLIERQPMSREEFIALRDSLVRMEMQIANLRMRPAPTQDDLRIKAPFLDEFNLGRINTNTQQTARMLAEFASQLRRFDDRLDAYRGNAVETDQAAHKWMETLQSRIDSLEADRRHLLARTTEDASYIQDLRERVRVLEQVPVKGLKRLRRKKTYTPGKAFNKDQSHD